jgi:hypothetical protein
VAAEEVTSIFSFWKIPRERRRCGGKGLEARKLTKNLWGHMIKGFFSIGKRGLDFMMGASKVGLGITGT